MRLNLGTIPTHACTGQVLNGSQVLWRIMAEYHVELLLNLPDD